MALPTGLTANEVYELLHSRIVYLENFIASLNPNFHVDIENFANAEINGSTVLNAASKTKLVTEITKIKDKVKPK